ncbi:protein FAM177A1-like isoform X2 [Zootermopsis nevadensis]|uniref:protein FAM177A1-like isoform X2 n=1 Tax=Zootermopsis nevadensis TaxID=136037 RepID=UPI000B8E4B66|nr:protein FAM177A1-like isoform X2 [Zootermopsis nevadensis]
MQILCVQMIDLIRKFTIAQASNEAEDKSCKVNLRNKKEPKKVIHFSDGTIEEYSDEDEPDTSAQITNKLNPSLLPWGSWIWYHTVHAGSKSLQVCDYLGEHLASFFGITTPKYQYEIDEYNRIMAEEDERQRKMDLEMGGWTEAPEKTEGAISAQLGDTDDMTHPTEEGHSDVVERKF